MLIAVVVDEILYEDSAYGRVVKYCKESKIIFNNFDVFFSFKGIIMMGT